LCLIGYLKRSAHSALFNRLLKIPHEALREKGKEFPISLYQLLAVELALLYVTVSGIVSNPIGRAMKWFGHVVCLWLDNVTRFMHNAMALSYPLNN
jgi:hypothetical protein